MNDSMCFFEQAVEQIGAQKACSTSEQYMFWVSHVLIGNSVRAYGIVKNHFAFKFIQSYCIEKMIIRCGRSLCLRYSRSKAGDCRGFKQAHKGQPDLEVFLHLED